MLVGQVVPGQFAQAQKAPVLGNRFKTHPRTELLVVRPGSLQLGFAVDNVDAFAADCAGFGVPIFQDPYDEPFGRVAVIGDPDGYPIQIVSSKS